MIFQISNIERDRKLHAIIRLFCGKYIHLLRNSKFIYDITSDPRFEDILSMYESRNTTNISRKTDVSIKIRKNIEFRNIRNGMTSLIISKGYK